MLGADAVVLFTALGGETEVGMIDILSSVGRECAALGMPFIAEAEFPTTYATVEELKQQYGFEYLGRNVRLCAELARHRQDQLAGRPRVVRQAGRGGEQDPVLAGGSRLEDKGYPADAGRGRGRRDRVLRRAEHLHARFARGVTALSRARSASGGAPTRPTRRSSRSSIR